MPRVKGVEPRTFTLPRASRSAGAQDLLQIWQSVLIWVAGPCFPGTAVIRTRTSGGVGAGGVNAPRYPILPRADGLSRPLRGKLEASSRNPLRKPANE